MSEINVFNEIIRVSGMCCFCEDCREKINNLWKVEVWYWKLHNGNCLEIK